MWLAKPTSTAKRRIGSVLRVAACIVMVFTLLGVIIFQNAGGFTTKTTPAQNGTGGAVVKDSFTLVAYAASPSSSVDSAALPSGVPAGAQIDVDSSTATPIQPNVTITLPTGKVETYKPDGTKIADFSSGFQFSGEDIASVTMTAQTGTFIAADGDKLRPQMRKELQWYLNLFENNPQYEKDPADAPKYQRTTDEQKIYDTYLKTGTTVTFPPSGFTAWWYPGNSINDNVKNISGTINSNVKFNDGTTENKTVTIGEGDSGNITATLS